MKEFLVFCAMYFVTAIAIASESRQHYEELIPPEAITRHGVFTTHRVANRLYFEIPQSALKADMLITRYRVGQRLIRWVRHGDQVNLVIPEIVSLSGTTISADPKFPRSNPPIVRSIAARFPILAEGPNGLVIEVTNLFLTNTPTLLRPYFLAGGPASWGRIDAERSFIGTVATHPDRIEIETTQTADPAGGDASLPLTLRSHWSVMRLPEQPMRPRLFDPRTGYFMETILDNHSDYTVATRASIVRWRLTKKNPSLAVSEPVEPIVFYFDPETPERWKPYIKAGVEAWQEPFEAAGFRNAIVVREAPVDDADWSIFDSRYSVVRWLDRTQTRKYKNLRGRGAVIGGADYILDPRTGEILKGEVYIGPPFEELRDRYFVRCAPLDPRAQTLPFPDELMGELIQSLVSHETGHALGLRDGNFGEYAYPIEKMRSREWLREMGHTPSIMNYARENYIPQPEDNIPPSDLIQRVGPADNHSIRWGYAPIPGAGTPDEELPILDAWLQEQDTVPWYRYARLQELDTGPQQSKEVVDNDDPVQTTTLGLKNLQRVMALLPNAARSPGGDNALLEHLYFRVLDQWRNEMKHVVLLLGGHTAQYKSGSQPGPVYTPVPGDRQREAMKFLAREALQTPLWLADTTITRRFEAGGTVSNIVGLQTEILKLLFNAQRLLRFSEIEATADDPDSIYSLVEMLRDIRRAVWTELSQRQVEIDTYRQELQQAHVLIVRQLVETEPQIGSHPYAYKVSARQRGLLLAELKELDGEIDKAIRRTKDHPTRAHLQWTRDMLNQ